MADQVWLKRRRFARLPEVLAFVALIAAGIGARSDHPGGHWAVSLFAPMVAGLLVYLAVTLARTQGGRQQ